MQLIEILNISETIGMEQQTQEKQKYLRDSILDCNYDAEEFTEYCVLNRGDVDIQAWTFTQLKEIVKDFINSKDDQRQKRGRRKEGVSFIEYQQKMASEHMDIDIDSFDINRNLDLTSDTHRQEAEIRVQEIGQGQAPSREKREGRSHEESSMWGPVSQAVITERVQDVGNLPQQQQTTDNDTNDLSFGEFSTPSSEGCPKEEVYLVEERISPAPTLKPKFSLNLDNLAKQQRSFKKLDLKSPTLEYKLSYKEQTPQLKATNAFTSESKMFEQPTLMKRHSDSTVLKHNHNCLGGRSAKEGFRDEVSCIKANTRNLLQSPLTIIEVTGHEIVSRSFVLPSHVVYSLLTKPLNIEVKRKYTHILKLRQVLGKFYPGVRLPYLDKAAWISESNTESIKTQKAVIQGFMNDILGNAQLKNCRILQEFLITKDKDVLKDRFCQYQQMAPLKSIEEMCLLEGSVTIAYNDSHRVYFQKLSPFLESMQSGIQKCKVLEQKLGGYYSALIKTYTELEEVFVHLENGIRAFNKGVSMCQFPELEVSIRRINDHYRQLNAGVRLESKLLEKDYKPLWTYESDNLGTLRELLEVRAKMTELYLKSSAGDLTNNEKYGSKKLGGFKTGITEASKHPAVLRYQVGFYNEASAEEARRLFSTLGSKINHKLVGMTAERYEPLLKETLDVYRTQRKELGPKSAK